MNLQQLRYVVAVAELGNFTRAAERCFVVQSALSHQIAKLEQELGARLFHRTSRSVALTPAGAALLPAARECLAAAERVQAEVFAATGEIRGRLAVGMIPTVAAVDVPAALRVFHQEYPQVRISLLTAGSDDLADRVRAGALDVAFLGLAEEVEIPDLNSQQLARDPLAALLAPDHRLAGHERIRLEAICAERFVDFPAGTTGRVQADRAFAAAGLERTVAFEITDPHIMARLVAEGLGVALLASTFAVRLPGVTVVPVVNTSYRLEHLVWSRLGPTPAANAFIARLARLARP
ncbi:LysR family transcriptional regulator [Plantactinospora sp. BC1]|uniref:LysR family transcriptional regulator n=1 Tax=Plantactinospora sp. BC1 TaxID=2108470 RepID=UPI000D17BB9B|nr:LysR family transcriptional regulator [Plantactinospora sp. BC1]AVT28180.1 LysR family transcriptional regulator [Plantactinospora sp. BC1]